MLSPCPRRLVISLALVLRGVLFHLLEASFSLSSWKLYGTVCMVLVFHLPPCLAKLISVLSLKGCKLQGGGLLTAWHSHGSTEDS